MKTFTLPASSETAKKFDAIRERKKFRNQADCFEHVVDVAYKEEMKEGVT